MSNYLSRCKKKNAILFLVLFFLFFVLLVFINWNVRKYCGMPSDMHAKPSSTFKDTIPERGHSTSQIHQLKSANSTTPQLPLVSTPSVPAPLNVSSSNHFLTSNSSPTIFIITPTYTRHNQKAELTRQCQTFTLVKNLHWIVIEDSDTRTELVVKLLDHCPVKSSLLNRETSKKLKRINSSAKLVNRGAQQRNIGLEWLREHYKPGEVEGVVYFADDDNTYDVRIFEEMRFTKKVSVWPVGFAGGVLAEGPRCINGKVVRFHSGWAPNRKFPLDMAAFAVNIDIILRNPKVNLNVKGTPGYLESDFLSLITTKNELEPKANDCTEVYVWHTETKTPVLAYERNNPSLLEV